MTASSDSLPVASFADQAAWAAWLDANHATERGIWLKLAKQATGIPSVTYADALESALCYGWIDGQKKAQDDTWWLQKFTPRGTKSVWSKINRQKAEQLIESGAMQPAGLRTVELAQDDGRWARACDSQATIAVPPDLQAALDARPEAGVFFATLDSRNRYAILYRIQGAKKSETRAKRIEQFVQMLANREKLYP